MQNPGSTTHTILTVLAVLIILPSLALPATASTQVDLSIDPLTIPTDTIVGTNLTLPVNITTPPNLNNNTWINVSLLVDGTYTTSINTTITLTTTHHTFTLYWIAKFTSHHPANLPQNRTLNFTARTGLNDPNPHNNYRTATITIHPPPPDLAFTTPITLTGTTTVGSLITLQATATNTGANTTETIHADCRINDKTINTTAIIGLQHGQLWALTFSWTPTTAGLTTVTIVLDPDHTVYELNETNNTATLVATITTVKIPWWNTSWHYRYYYNATGTGNLTKTVNFTAALHTLGLTSKPLEDATITVVKYAAGKNNVIPYKFTRANDYASQTNAKGDLTWAVTGRGFYLVYFDTYDNNGTRTNLSKPIHQNPGTAVIDSTSNPEGWWLEPSTVIQTFYLPNTDFTITLKTVAKAKSVTADLLLNGHFNRTLTFSTLDTLKWTQRLNLPRGNWSIRATAIDNAGYINRQNYSLNITIPDIALTYLRFPNTPTEGNVTITAYATATNATVPDVRISFKCNSTYLLNSTGNVLPKDKNTSFVCYWHPTQGTYKITVTISCSDYTEPNTANNNKTATVTVQGAADFTVVDISLPSTALNEYGAGVIATTIRNNGHKTGVNYTIALFVEQHDPPNVLYTGEVNSTTISLDVGETMIVDLTWSPVKYGDEKYRGEWLRRRRDSPQRLHPRLQRHEQPPQTPRPTPGGHPGGKEQARHQHPRRARHHRKRIPRHLHRQGDRRLRYQPRQHHHQNPQEHPTRRQHDPPQRYQVSLHPAGYLGPREIQLYDHRDRRRLL